MAQTIGGSEQILGRPQAVVDALEELTYLGIGCEPSAKTPGAVAVVGAYIDKQRQQIADLTAALRYAREEIQCGGYADSKAATLAEIDSALSLEAP